MYYVYLLRSLSHPDQKYVGITEDLKKRHADHNNGFSKHTAKYMPWGSEHIHQGRPSYALRASDGEAIELCAVYG